jgi:hypothetical protein
VDAGFANEVSGTAKPVLAVADTAGACVAKSDMAKAVPVSSAFGVNALFPNV